MKKITTIALLLIVLAGTGIFLSNKGKETETQPETVVETPSLPEIKIAQHPLASSELITKTIISQELDKKNGFTLVGVQMQPLESLPAILTERVDLKHSDLTEILRNKTNEKELIAISEGFKAYCSVMVFTDSKFTSIKDLAGEKVAVMKKPSYTYLWFDVATMVEFDQTAQERYELKEVDIQNLSSTLLSGAVDGMETCNIIQQAKLLASGKVKSVGSVNNVLEKSLENETPMILAFTVGRKNWIEENPELVNKYITAQEEAFKYLAENTAAMIKENYVDPGTLTEEEAAELTRIIEESGYFNQIDWQEIIKDSEKFIQLAKDTKNVDQDVATDGIFYSK